MHVALVTRPDLFPPVHGAAVRTIRGAEAMAAAGARVSIVTEDRDSWLLFQGGTWRELPYTPRVRAAEEWPPLPWLGRLAERLCGLVGYPPEEAFLYRPMFDPAWWLRVAAMGRQHGVDVFQAEFPGFGVPALVAARLLGRRAVVVEHNVEYHRLAQMSGLSEGAIDRLRVLEAAVLRAVDDVVVVSDEDRRLVSAMGVGPGRITVIPHGVELEPHRLATGSGVRERHGIPRDAPLLFFHGVLHYHPNAEAVGTIVAELLPRLLPKHPDLRVVVAGMNPPTYYSHPAVVFPGVVDDLPEYVAAADVAVCPLDSGGGTRLKLLEYFAGARPVVSTAKGAEGLRCRHGRELLLAEGPDAFAAGVSRLLEDRALARELGEGARRFAERYDWQAIGAAHISLYRGEGRGEDWNERLLARPILEPGAVEAGGLAGHGSSGSREPGALGAGGPLTMLLLLNRGCNLRCSFCDLSGDPARLDVGARLPTLLDDAVHIGTSTVVLTGGEPFLHPELFRAVRLARERALTVNITTNGTMVDARWEELMASPPDSVSVSVDGREEAHDCLRGVRGSWARAVGATERLAREGGVGVNVLFTLTSANAGDLEHVWGWARELGAGFDFWPVNDAPALAVREPDQVESVRRALHRMAAADPAVAERLEFHLDGLEYHGGSILRVRCLGLVNQYGVTWEGDLLPCCQWGARQLVVGNVFRAPLHRLWRSREARELSRRIMEEGCGARCYNHSLYDFRRATGLTPVTSRR